MASRKSSITAELKLAGQAQFKSGLNQIGMEANKLGKTLREMKPITFDGGANQAKKAWALTEEHQRAHHRVMERQAKLNKGRMEALGLGGMGSAGSTRARGGGGGSSYGLGVGYNAIQDLVQGGPAAIANNIPQIVEMVSKSPKLQKGLAGAAAVAALGYGIKEVMDAYQKHGSVVAESARMAEGRGMVRNQFQAVEQGNRVAEAQITGTSQAKRIAEIDTYSRKVRNADDQEHQASLRKMGMMEILRLEKISTGADEVKVIKETAASQIAFIDNQTKIEEDYSNTAMRLAEERKTQAIQLAKEAEAELFAIQQGNRRAGTSASDAELVRQAELEKTAPAMQARADAAKQEYDAAVARVTAAKEERETAKISKDLIKLKEEADLKQLEDAETERYIRKLDNEIKQQEADRQKKAKEKEKAAEKEKDRQSIRDRLTGEEELLNMSPRKRAKAERELKKTKDIEELQKKGFSPTEAASMAERGIKLEEANDPSRPKRIRGAGFGRDDASRDRRTTFSALEDLEAFQPATGKERKTIKGAGNKDQDKKSGTNDKPESAADAIVQGLAKVEKAIREGNPNATERGRPTSSRTSTA